MTRYVNMHGSDRLTVLEATALIDVISHGAISTKEFRAAVRKLSRALSYALLKEAKNEPRRPVSDDSSPTPGAAPGDPGPGGNPSVLP